MNNPLVSVVCLCYNHERFVQEAIQSVLNQTYHNVQLVVVDDHSTDNSLEKIKESILQHPSTILVALSSNQGNCRAFNRGLEMTRGDFIIDLSGDDVLMPERIERGVRLFQSHPQSVGVQFSDAQLITEKGVLLGLHSDRFPHVTIPQGNIYRDVLARYFINSPTMMMRKQVFDKLGGYDESLAYEDFDFWVRSSRHFQYCYIPEVLVKRRVVSSSLGKRQRKSGSSQLRSTLTVCKKAFELNENETEYRAFKSRLLYELRQALLLGEFGIAWNYLNLWGKKLHRRLTK